MTDQQEEVASQETLIAELRAENAKLRDIAANWKFATGGFRALTLIAALRPRQDPIQVPEPTPDDDQGEGIS